MKIKLKRGYCGIGVFYPKTSENIGTLWRSAHNFNVDFLFTIGERYKKQPTDTMKSFKYIPLYHYNNWEDFIIHLPMNAELVIIEQYAFSHDLKNFIHPENGIYILGSEDRGIPEEFAKGHRKIMINTKMCLNVAVAGSIVLFDRNNKR